MQQSVQDLAWSEELNTDITSLDMQHKNLAYKVESLKVFGHISPLPEEAYDSYLEIIADLHTHFAYEEKIMENIGYDEFVHHRDVHSIILNKLDDIQKTVLTPRDKDKIQAAIKFLEETIVSHLSGEDTKIRTHLHRL